MNSIVLRPNIFFITEEKNSQFENSVRSSISSLETLSIGRRLLEKIGRASHPIYIKFSQGHCPPPPLLNCIRSHLDSNRAALLYTIVYPNSPASPRFLFVKDPLSNSPPSDFVRQEFNIKDYPDDFKIENFCPHIECEVQAIGIYRLSASEAEALDQQTAINEVT